MLFLKSPTLSTNDMLILDTNCNNDYYFVNGSLPTKALLEQLPSLVPKHSTFFSMKTTQNTILQLVNHALLLAYCRILQKKTLELLPLINLITL